jgi:hypothetical protein
MEPICTECKITGRHSTKKFYDHSIIPFLDACQMLKEKIIEGSKTLTSTRDCCIKELDRFKDKVNCFKDNILGTRKQIEREFKNLMLQLDNIEDSQRQVINAKYLYRLCKFESLDRLDSYPKELDPADLLTEYKNISDQRRNESLVVFDKLEMEKFEIQGKISLKNPKDNDLRVPNSDSKDKSIKWRIETLDKSKDGSKIVS